MAKRFKAKTKSKYKIIKIIVVLLIVYVSFGLIYNLIYNLYLSRLSNEEVIALIIKNSKNGKLKWGLDKIQNPQVILEDVFTFKEENTGKGKEVVVGEVPKVYIYNTHETEGYSDKYLEVYNIKPNVKMMSYILKDYLNDLGINAIVEDKSVTDVLKKNGWSYKYSYDASKELVVPVLQANTGLGLVVDLHRDSAPLSKTLLETTDTKYARILFVVGKEYEGYEVNQKVAERLKTLLEEEVPGITRGLSLKEGDGVNGIYNQNLSSHSVLIELGGQYNEIEEINNTLKVLAKVFLRYLEE